VPSSSRTDDQRVVEDGRRRSHEIIAPLPRRIIGRTHALEEIERTPLAEVGAGAAGRRVERQQAGVERRRENAGVADRIRRAGCIDP
jgi:hypothetical protein